MRRAEDAFSANIAWRHQADADELLLTSILGQGIARLVRAADRATLTTQDAREFGASDIETLTEEVLGYRVPVSGLADWVRGRRTAGPAQETRDRAGRLLTLEQHGWTIEYRAWSDSGPSPARLDLRYPGLELRLVITEFREAR